MTINTRVRIPDGLWTGLKKLGINAYDLVRKTKMPLTVITEQVVTVDQYYALWQAYSDIIGDMEVEMLQLPTVFETTQYPRLYWQLTMPVIIGMLLKEWLGTKKCVLLKNYALWRKTQIV